MDSLWYPALVVAYFAFRHGLKFLANFSTWAKNLLNMLNNFWSNLFGNRSEVSHEPAEESAAVAEKPRPFAEFQNPFDGGAAARGGRRRSW